MGLTVSIQAEFTGLVNPIQQERIVVELDQAVRNCMADLFKEGYVSGLGKVDTKLA